MACSVGFNAEIPTLTTGVKVIVNIMSVIKLIMSKCLLTFDILQRMIVP